MHSYVVARSWLLSSFECSHIMLVIYNCLIRSEQIQFLLTDNLRGVCSAYIWCQLFKYWEEIMQSVYHWGRRSQGEPMGIWQTNPFNG